VSSALSAVGAIAGALLPMGLMILLGIVWLVSGHAAQIDFSWKSFLPDLSNVKNLVFLTAVVFGLVGMEMSAVHADEVRDPGRAYPRAIFYSTIIIFISLVFSSLSIAIVVPGQTLNIVTGVEQALRLFSNAYHLRWMDPVVILMIVIGGIGTVAAWIIGPTKGLLIAVRDGSAPPFFAKTNRWGVPIIILLMQAIIFTVLCSIFLLMPTVSGAYWVLTAMTAQLAMLVYVGLFAAGIYLRYKKPDVVRAFKIPGGKVGLWIVGLLGTSSCLVVIGLGFIPPAQIDVGDWLVFETILISGILLLTAPPIVMYLMRKPTWKT